MKLSLKTALTAAALSASGSAGLFCLMVVLFTGLDPRGAHPLDTGFGIAGGILMLAASIALLCLYVRLRKKAPSLGILLDLLLLVLLFVPFFLLWGYLEGLLSRLF